MNDKIKVDLKDKLRVLMTELLPYELPLWYSNELLYVKLKENEKILDNITCNTKIKNYVPFDYKIKKTGGGYRILSIMHPKIQVELCDFYNEYQDLIIYYCNRSNKSLRYPEKVVNAFFKKEVYETSNEHRGPEENEKNFTHFISFFKYNKYPFLYKFFESYDYNKLEKRFQSLVQVDVSKCFHSIYTHSISWATKNKYISKRDLKKGGFDQKFDHLMQKSNYSETNGILIGPEISRIFAEIIFQDIDLKIISHLEGIDCKIGIHYDFRRYVDDYFVYFNDEKIKEQVIDVINSELFHYKMHLNDTKTFVSNRPFITNISLCKIELSKFIQDLFIKRYTRNESIKKLELIKSPGNKANHIISGIKAIIKKNNVHYFSICNYMISIFSLKVTKFISSYTKKIIDSEVEKRLIPWLLIDIEILYFIHAMDPRIISSDKLTKIMLEILRLDNVISTENNYLVQKKIFDASIEAIRIFKTSSNITYPIETMNILLLLTKIKTHFKLDESFIKKSFCLANEIKSPTEDILYFLWSSLMLYITDDFQYQNIRKELNAIAKNFFLENIHGFESTAFLLFWGDFLACPYVEEDDKKEIVRFKIKTEENRFNKYIKDNFNSKKGIIINWNEVNWLSKSIDKKVFKYAYE